MPQTEWKHINTIQKKIRITRIENQRDIYAFDIEQGTPIYLNTDKTIDLSKIKRAKIYQATLKVYETEFTPELQQRALESAIGNPQKFKAIQTMKASGTKPIKYELTALKH
ncbi:hypothetical protein [Candidatus Bathycorpusculum sp.]|uniref:hypothetical protein n=1 Tax=Candidatus Bathycorpusculum sp. TaxID=2994959 RepID=UPI0028388DB9|nr:hypothetical protein [Candidatus Termitimicrobium sp.]MCL2432557.1 hypothetical protein [Candidatus Termitimicrobium sp.]